jgi:hypothetical protein
MSGATLTTASTLKCPHGGTVAIVSSNARASVNGTYAALATDTFTISGCPFQLPTTPPVPSPCMTVQWIVPDVQTTVNNTPTLSESSVGLCLAATQAPQGPVSITAGQAKAQSR